MTLIDAIMIYLKNGRSYPFSLLTHEGSIISGIKVFSIIDISSCSFSLLSLTTIKKMLDYYKCYILTFRYYIDL